VIEHSSSDAQVIKLLRIVDIAQHVRMHRGRDAEVGTLFRRGLGDQRANIQAFIGATDFLDFTRGLAMPVQQRDLTRERHPAVRREFGALAIDRGGRSEALDDYIVVDMGQQCGPGKRQRRRDASASVVRF
jgi:hypothetical protein